MWRACEACLLRCYLHLLHGICKALVTSLSYAYCRDVFLQKLWTNGRHWWGPKWLPLQEPRHPGVVLKLHWYWESFRPSHCSWWKFYTSSSGHCYRPWRASWQRIWDENPFCPSMTNGLSKTRNISTFMETIVLNYISQCVIFIFSTKTGVSSYCSVIEIAWSWRWSVNLNSVHLELISIKQLAQEKWLFENLSFWSWAFARNHMYMGTYTGTLWLEPNYTSRGISIASFIVWRYFATYILHTGWQQNIRIYALRDPGIFSWQHYNATICCI